MDTRCGELYSLAIQIRECFSAADDAGVGAGHEYFGWARLGVVLRGHAVAVRASSANGEQVAALQCGQAALARKYICGFADWAGNIGRAGGGGVAQW